MIDSLSADFEHEIPNGSRLYFGKNAALKRKIENIASEILLKNDFNEILTPCFSYHQNLGVKSGLLKFSDPQNNEIALRADSTVDVVRIVRRRLKNENLKRWFYMQPIFKYPSKEFYQIGAEMIDERNLSLAIKIALEIFSEFGLKPVLQLSNIEIPKLICQILGISIDVFEKGAIEVLLQKDIKWLNDITKATTLQDLKALKNSVPSELKDAINDIENLGISYENVRISLLYYSKMRYYDELFFRFLDANSILCSGGNYKIDGTNSSGFAVMVDAMIEKIIYKD
ncbi:MULTISPECIES: ATP phosphoribosyltransferase regulatory subunit [unclassified Campylobacter]|uniref:ATP phosphoribosyltransferase regulatory subunit n=1 Tax=unclassified Campylobacter TaxID=2593542 RepID=UPI0022E9A94B|nr:MULTISPECIES: ATP phosphoribosyltransferase regulatory subunit [unclassified Campylobacter]MBQ2430596.1 ATP phosphoribosyltransferase regulatory subunit [Campylobacter sp.]MDA3079494.1 ATP phosphoribosyltransferase regulatory subunit [Campylobacter sp. CS_NA2]MDA3081073.1 ATP phosphoribosyltransferase regulatory subunit [Campylobacter sp. CS_NA1]MDA3085624.1 ATP phosphoribosyltransferase regulatory subunit [Campylobacter sp. CS_ED1]MDA3090328.1 ATP phosphoribosyltransferase regulatory subun